MRFRCIVYFVSWLCIDASGIRLDPEKVQTVKSFKKNGVLYRKNFSTTERKFILTFPSGVRRDLLYACHDGPEGGNLGIDKTLARISSLYWWLQMTKSVRRYVLSCVFLKFHKS